MLSVLDALAWQDTGNNVATLTQQQADYCCPLRFLVSVLTITFVPAVQGGGGRRSCGVPLSILSCVVNIISSTL